MITYGSHGKELFKNGYQVIPLASETKIPVTEGWVHASSPPEYTKYPNCSIGIRCGTHDPVYAIDIDVTNFDFIEGMVKESGLSQAPHRIGSFPKRLYLFKGLTDKIRKKSSSKYIEGHVEILGFGQQFAAFGVHPKTKRPYQWPYGSPVSINQNALPILTEIDMTNLLNLFEEMADVYGFRIKEKKKERDPNRIYEPDNPLFEKAPLNISENNLREMVETLDFDCGREMWRDVGFALHHQTEGSDVGYQIWDEWSSKGTKYKDGETETQWDSFGRSDKEPITAAYINKLYKAKQVEETNVAVADEVGIDPDDMFAGMNWSVDRFSSEPPPLEMVVESIIPRGITALLFSAGGAGKSTLMLYLATRTAFANFFPVDFAGYTIHGGSVVILTAEDPDVILNRRYIAMVTELSRELDIPIEEVRDVLSKNLHIASTFGKPSRLFGIKNDMIKPTKAFLSLLRRLKTIPNLQFVIIDTKTRYSPGEGTGNVTAAQEVTYYEMIATATGATVVLLHHTNKKSRDGSQDGAQAYRDATAWFDNTRASWFFRPVTPKEASVEGLKPDDVSDYFVLENAKNNYVKRHKDKLVHRVGYNFNFTDSKTSGDKEDTKDQSKQDLMDSMASWMQVLKENDVRQAEVIRWGKEVPNAGRSKVISALSAAVDDGIIELTDGGAGRTKRYSLTDYGLLYNLHID